MTQENPFTAPGITLESDLAELAAELRHVTVQVRGAGQGAGSGIVWTRDGLIVTNAHVVVARWHTIELSDGRVFEAQLIRREPAHDLAILQIAASRLKCARLRDPTSLRTGELVVAVGNPMGMAGAFTVGMLSAKPARDGVFLRSDIRLAPGNSGGPLADVHGQVVGVNSMVADGFGIAISSRVVQRLVSQSFVGATRASVAEAM